MTLSDEPTSGLDSQTAWSICTLLRKLSDNGQAVLCTIHQPSSQLFMLFDRLLLLNSKGQCVYFGDIGKDASTLVSYFEERGAQPPAPGANPAEWILKTTSRETTEASNDLPGSEFWAREWAASQQQKDVTSHLVELKARGPGTPEKVLGAAELKSYATPWLSQMGAVTRRIFQEYWRRPVYIYSKFALCIGIALFDGLSFQNTRLDLQGFQNLLFSMFLLMQIFGTMDQQVIPRLMEGRAIFEGRERRSATYHWTIFLTSNVVVEFTWQLLASVLIYVIWYCPTGLWRTGEGDAVFGVASRGALSFVIVLFFCLWTISFSQALAAVIELEESCVQIATLLFYFSLVFCGVLVFPRDLPSFWILVWRASPLTYFVDGLSLAGLWNVDLTCSPAQTLHIPAPCSEDDCGSATITCGDYLAAFAEQNLGAVMNPASTTGSCEYCPLASTNSFFRETLQTSGEHPWYHAGYLSTLIVFNILAMFSLYWVFRVRGKSGGLS